MRRILLAVLIAWGIYAVPNYFVYRMLKAVTQKFQGIQQAYVDQTSDTLPLDSTPSQKQPELYVLLLQPQK